MDAKSGQGLRIDYRDHETGGGWHLTGPGEEGAGGTELAGPASPTALRNQLRERLGEGGRDEADRIVGQGLENHVRESAARYAKEPNTTHFRHLKDATARAEEAHQTLGAASNDRETIRVTADERGRPKVENANVETHHDIECPRELRITPGRDADVIAEVPEHQKWTIELDGEHAGDLRIEGKGIGNGVRNGSGDGNVVCATDSIGSAVRDGAGAGDAVREGFGNGEAIHRGSGRGNAVRDGFGHGDAVRRGQGSGDAVRSGRGMGNAHREGNGDGDAICSTRAQGDAIAQGAGTGNALRRGRGAGNAIVDDERAGSAKVIESVKGTARNSSRESGDAVNDAELDGAAVRNNRGAGSAVRSGAGDGAAHRHGDGDGHAWRAGSGDGTARHSGSGDGHAINTTQGRGYAARDGFGGVGSRLETRTGADGVKSWRPDSEGAAIAEAEELADKYDLASTMPERGSEAPDRRTSASAPTPEHPANNREQTHTVGTDRDARAGAEPPSPAPVDKVQQVRIGAAPAAPSAGPTPAAGAHQRAVERADDRTEQRQ